MERHTFQRLQSNDGTAMLKFKTYSMSSDFLSPLGKQVTRQVKITIFCDVMQGSLVEAQQHFEAMCCLCLQGRTVDVA
jgi:hypothetical protein